MAIFQTKQYQDTFNEQYNNSPDIFVLVHYHLSCSRQHFI